VTPPPLDRWIEAALMLCVSLVQGAATTLGMIFNRTRRDWHTTSANEDLPQATSSKQSQESNTTHGVILGQAKRDPRISVGPSRGLANDPLETNNRDSRHKAENHPALADASGMEADKVRVPGAGRGPALRTTQAHIRKSALTYPGQVPPTTALRLKTSRD
jgi:hypothetical protein